MEPPRRAVALERALAVVVLAGALGAAWAENRSELALSLRLERPWTAWVEARAPGRTSVSSFHLAVYLPARRHLTVLHLPGPAPAAEERARRLLAGLARPVPPPTARIHVPLPPPADEDEPSVEVAESLKFSTRRMFAGPRLPGLDDLILALELRRLPPERLLSARATEDSSTSLLLESLLSPEEPPSNAQTVTAEVLNGAGERGLASDISKMLRLKGVDVIAVGDGRPRARTLVYDRTGDARRAAQVKAALDCPSARAATRVDPSRTVDVSVELGRDCAEGR